MSSTDHSEDREFSRVPFQIQALLKTGSGEIEVPKTRDISLKGVFLEGVPPQTQGTDCEVLLTLKGVEPPIEMHLHGKIQRLDSAGCAVEFNQIPLESFDHLQRLVRLNSQDPNRMDDEIQKHVGLHPR